MKRETVSTAIQPLGMFAVMRHRSNTKNAKFCKLHDSHASALDEAQRLSVGVIEQYGADANFCFYVVEIVGRVGIIDGALQSSP